MAKLVGIAMQKATSALLDGNLSGAESVISGIRDLQRGGISVLLVEHNLKVVSALCPHVLAMDAGKVVAQGTVQSLASSEAFAEAYLGKRAPKTPQE